TRISRVPVAGAAITPTITGLAGLVMLTTAVPLESPIIEYSRPAASVKPQQSLAETGFPAKAASGTWEANVTMKFGTANTHNGKYTRKIAIARNIFMNSEVGEVPSRMAQASLRVR